MLSDALDSIFNEIQEFQLSLTISPTAIFLHPQKYSPKLILPPALKIPSIRPNTKSIVQSLDPSAAPRCQFPVESVALPATPTAIPVKWTFESEAVRLSPLLPRESPPRFPPITIREKLAAYKPSIRALSPEEIHQVAQRIQSNISKARTFTPTARIQAAKAQASREVTRLALRRAARNAIWSNRLRKRQEDLQAKTRRLEWRRNAGEVEKGREMWAGGMVALGVLGRWRLKMVTRKALHSRAKGLLLWLLGVSQTCGKLRRSLQLKREKRAFETLRSLLPYINRRKKAIKAQKAEILADILETHLSREVLRRLIVVWKARVRLRQVGRLQSAVRTFAAVRAAQRLLLRLQWEQLEARTLSRPIPALVKEAVIKENVRNRARKYAQALMRWAESVKIVKETSPDGAFGLLSHSPKPQPPKPHFRRLLSPEDLQALLTATERRSHRFRPFHA